MKVSASVLQQELQKRSLRKELILDADFVAQNAFINDPNRFIAAQCSRRAGKTNGLAIRFLRTLEKYPKCQCPYIALTRESAKDIMWPVLEEMNKTYNIGLVLTESNLTARHPNGSKLKLYGADQKNFIRRLKGRKFPGVAIDEAQDFGSHLATLINDVLTPAIADYPDSWIALTGTPGPVPIGYFFDVTHGRRFGYSVHEWTILDNIYMRGAASFIEELKSKHEWEETNPTLLREWRNQWVLDTEALWINYNKEKCDYELLPIQKYVYILGIDLGFKDADALAVVAWSETDAATYLVEEVITKGQNISELVTQISNLQSKYDISKMVIDQGGLGLKVAEEIRRRHHIPVVGAEKQRKQETVSFLNDHLRRGTFKAKTDSKFAQDSYLVQIDWDKSTPDRIIVKKQPHSDIIDAVIYAFKESPAYTYQAVAPKPKHGTPDWANAEQLAMEQAAQEHFEQLAENAKTDEFGY